MSARWTQSVKQLERKQSEIDEIQGRLKASRERVEELEKHHQNSTTTAQKREMVFFHSNLSNLYSHFCFIRQQKNPIEKSND